MYKSKFTGQEIDDNLTKINNINVNQINEDIETLKTQTQTNTTDITGLTTKTNDLQAQVSGLSTQVSGQQTQITNLQDNKLDNSNGVITSNLLADGSITSAKIAEHQVTDEKLEVTTLNKINKSLQTPTTAPTSTELVGIDTNKTQVNIGIGDGLAIENGTLKATGGGGGTTQNLYMHNFNISRDIENIDIYFQLLSTVEQYDLTNPENIFVNTLSDGGIVLASGSVDYSNNQRLIITGISIRTSNIIVYGVNINNGYIINDYQLTSTINDVDISDAVIPVE